MSWLNEPVFYADRLDQATASLAPFALERAESALSTATAWLTAFASSASFGQTLGTAFGDAFNLDDAQALQVQWARGDGGGMPRIQIRTGDELQGALGAFSQATQTIYLSRDYLEQPSTDSWAIASVLLEEVGHFVDSRINIADALGDEGAIFSALVRGVSLDVLALQALKTEDDSATITLDGSILEIEQATVNGLRGEYFDNANLTDLKLTRTDNTIDFNWGTGSPSAAIAPNTFSVRWTGQVQTPTSGTYTFFTQADDGIRLWVNGQQIINNWTNRSVTENSGTIALTAGQNYDIRVEYYDNTGAAVSRLLWSGPGVTKQIIPQSQLFSPSSDSTLPTASAAIANVMTAGATTYDFTVTYADNIAVNAATLDGNDVRVTGPNGFNQLASLVGVNPVGNGTPRTATYRIAAPGGVWDSPDNGTYTVALQTNQVSDTSGNFVTARTLGTFLATLPNPDTTAPTATVTAANVTAAGGVAYDFTVTYSDNVAVNAATLDGNDVRVTGPNSFNQLASLVSVNSGGNGTPRTATYRVAAPGGVWDSPDNGTYTVALQTNQVSDTSGNFVTARTLGTFLATLPNPDTTAPTATVTAANVTAVGGVAYDFTVTYSDNVAVNAATLDGNDVRVTGPNSFNQLASLVSVNSGGNGTPRTATYRVAAPGGVWDTVDNGTYTLALQSSQVSDTSGNFVASGPLGSFVVNLAPLSTGENIVFPADAGVLNVKDFGAKGDGITDDTEAIQAALNAYPNGMRIIYLPNGTYLVSDTLTWPAGTPGTGNDYKNTILQGQSQQGAIIKLKNNAAGFTNSGDPQAVIFTGPSPAQRFGNSIRNITVDTGTGNSGAIGVQFNASNQGSMRQVTIQSGDGQGVAGLDFDFADEIGPLLVKDVTIKGFQYGIQTGYTVNSQTFENITLQNQSVYGFFNYSQVVSIRNLTSTNAVPVIYNALGDSFNPNSFGHMTLINATLNGVGNASSKSAIVSGGTLLARDITTTGYQSAIASGSTVIPGGTVTEFVSKPVTSLFTSPPKTLNLPIKETPNVPWDNLTDWASVVAFGAIPNDGIDDSAAFQAAIDSGKTTVYLPVGNYDLSRTVFVRNNVRRIIGTEAFVNVPNTGNPAFRIVDGSQPTVVFERIRSWDNGTPTLENASSRTLVVRDTTDVSLKLTGTGELFLENVATSALIINGQNVWARQLNIENLGTKIVNNGGNLWILGLKTERGGTIIDTRNGGKTELLGGLAYTTTAGPDGTQNYPMFINNESAVSLSLAEVNYGAPGYTTYIRETRGGVTRNVSGSSLPNYWGIGEDIPLYVGYLGS